MTFRRKTQITKVNWQEHLMVIFDDGQRVIVKNEEGNVMLDVSKALFDQCWARGDFEERP